jgi:hypothetical protein
MNTSTLRRMLGKGHGGTFRPLKAGELIQAADVIIHDSWLEGPSDTSIGEPCKQGERIVRLEFQEKLR